MLLDIFWGILTMVWGIVLYETYKSLTVERVLPVKFKKLSSNARVPKYAKPGDAGLDLTAITLHYNYDNAYVEIGTGLAIEIPKGNVGFIFPRSSISNTSHNLRNSVAVIDSSYRGEIKLRFSIIDGQEDKEYKYGDRVGQLIIMPYPEIELQQVEELSVTERNTGGFGHSN